MKKEKEIVETLSIDDYLHIIGKGDNYKKSLSITSKEINGFFSSNKEVIMRSRTMDFGYKPQYSPKPK